MVDLFRYRKWDIVTPRGLYYLISGLMLLAGLVAFCWNWSSTGRGLNEGIDFVGGGMLTYSITGHLPAGADTKIIGDLRETLKSSGIETEVQVSPSSALSTAGDQVIVRTLLANKDNASEDKDNELSRLEKDTITPAVTKVLQANSAELDTKGGKSQPEGRELVTGSISRELKVNGTLAMIIGSFLIMLWIWLRYNVSGFGLRYGVAGILALLHDLGTLIGMFALLHNFLQVNSPFIAALLTVLGYSIHDTIVIFDRIRENMRLRKGRTFAETVNISLLETMARSVNTILTVLFTLLALFFFGGPTLRDFVAAMLIGVTVGGYSSIFVASQLLVSWSKPKEKVILPYEEHNASPSVPFAPKPAMAGAGVVNVASLQADADAVDRAIDKAAALQRARQAGKTARRKR